MKKKFTFMMAALMLLVFMMPSMAGWGQKGTSTYTISLKDNGGGSDASTSMGYNVTSAYVSDYVSVTENLGYVNTISFNNYVYKASTNNGWKLSSGKSAGSFSLNLTTAAQALTVSKVTINAKNYGTDATTLTVTITKGDNSDQSQSFTNLDDDFDDYDLTLTSASTIKTITVAADAKSHRAYVHHITVTYSTGTDTYDVTYKANGGTGNDFVDNNGGAGYASGVDVIVKANEGSGNPNFTRTGYTFTSWNTQANGGGESYVNPNTFPISGNTNLFAQWTKNNYNVAVSSIEDVTLTATYGFNTIAEGYNANVPYGTAVTLAATGLAEGKTFVWSITKTDGGDDVTEEVLDGTTLTVPDYAITIGGAVVSIYTVTYDCNGGNSGCPDNVTGIAAGSSITLADAPAKTGHVFTGWNDGTTTYDAGDFYTVNNNATLTAQWTAGGTITFNKNAVVINSTSVTGEDSSGNEWTITTVFPTSTTSFTNTSTEYSQVGSSSTAATSITFTTTLPGQANISAFSAKFGGFSGTAGTITLKVGETTIGSGSLNAGNDVIVENSSSALGTVLTVTVTSIAKGVKCYYISYSYTTGSDPVISVLNTINLSSTDTNNEFAFEIVNPVSGKTLSASTTTDWISTVVADNVNNKVSFTTTENETTSDRSGSITLSYDGATDKVVTINQSKKDYAEMPFAYDGNGTGDLPTGFTQTGLSTYASSPKMKFDGTGDYAVLKLHEAPTSISYDIIGSSSSWLGSFKVQTSADGLTYSDLDTYGNSDLTNTAKTVTHIDLPSTVRYIRWIFDSKTSGFNVGVGNIKASTNYDIYSDVTAANVTIPATKTCTIYSGATLTVSNTLTNNGTAANLVIEDGGQLICNNSVAATVKRTTKAWDENDQTAKGWYAISSPVNNVAIADFAKGTHNVYSYDEPTHYWHEYNSSLGEIAAFDHLANGRGYLYRSTEANIEFAGDVNIANATYTLSYTYAAGNLAGFHLIGNPYTHNIYKGDNAAINSGYLTDGLYTLNVNGGWEAGTDNSTVIAPGCAVLVQTTEAGEGQTLTITNTDHQGPQAKYANDQIMFTVENTEYTDNTYVLFKKGQGLNKIEHRNAEIPMLYVISEGENYAIADMPDNTDVINLGFEAKTMGQYTISLKAEGQYSYMHLVDKLTGNDIDMLVEDSYTFVGTPNDRNDRFVLRLNYNAAGIDSESDIFAYQSGNDIMVSGEGELQVFDVTGRKVMATTINGVETINGMNRGVYIFRLNEKTQKIVVR